MKKEKYQILVKDYRLRDVLDDWVSCGQCDLVLRIARTDGCRVVETTDTVYAARMVKYLCVAERVNIVTLNNN